MRWCIGGRSFIFINYSDKPESFDKIFSPLIDRFKDWTIDKLTIVETKQYTVLGNWKLVIQNYCECYHCPILHPDLAAITPYLGGQNDLHDGPFLGGYMELNKNKEDLKSDQINTVKSKMELNFSCGEDGISEFLSDGWIIVEEYSKEKICTWKSFPATKDCDMEKDKGCKITTPDKIGEEKVYLLEK